MLLAPDIRDWLAADHPVGWVDARVEDGLDLSSLYDDYPTDGASRSRVAYRVATFGATVLVRVPTRNPVRGALWFASW